MSWIADLLAPQLQVAGTALPRRRTINLASGMSATDDPSNNRTNVEATGGGGGGGGGGHVIQEESTPLAQRAALAFIGTDLTAADDSGAGRTTVTLNRTSASTGGTIPTVGLTGRVLGTADGASSSWRQPNLTRVTSVPTSGFWQAGDELLWSGVERLALRATLTGALGQSARTNSNAYSKGALISQNSRLFVCITAGTSAGSAPGAYAAAVFGEIIQDGTAFFECVGTAVQGPAFESVPRTHGTPVTLANSDATVQIGDGPIRECAAHNANRTTTIGETGAVAGDVLKFRQMNTGIAFSWTFTAVGGGGDSIVIPANQIGVVTFMYQGSAWVLDGATGTIL